MVPTLRIELRIYPYEGHVLTFTPRWQNMVEMKGIEPSDSNLAKIARNPITIPIFNRLFFCPSLFWMDTNSLEEVYL